MSAVLALILFFGKVGAPAALASSSDDAGHRDFSFGDSGASAAGYGPTGAKPQSKLWFNDGHWWGVFFDSYAEAHQIYRYDWTAHAWNNTGTVVDERDSSRADVLWDGNHLYVVSAGPSSDSGFHSARLSRYGYDPATKDFRLDEGYPVNITSGGTEAIVLAKDTAGKLWATYTQNERVYVSHSLDDDSSWAEPFVLPVEGATVASDDISSVIAFGDQIGVMWSNQVNDAFYFAVHRDGEADQAWTTSVVLQGPGVADDHINLKADSGGRVFAAVKTALDEVPNRDPSSPLNLLLTRSPEGNWTSQVFGRVSDRHTRPMALIDEEHRDLYVFATSPCCEGGQIYYKRTSLDDVHFAEGLGEPFISGTVDTNVNDATSTKQHLNGQTRLLVEAADVRSGYYLHSGIDLSATDTACTVVESPGPDELEGTAEADVICGRGGR